MRLAILTLLAVALAVAPTMLAHAAPGGQSLAMGSGGHKLQIRSDGTLWVWGYNNNGQLGLGDTADRLVPVQAGTDTDWVSVAAGGYAGVGHSLALKDDGTLWAWGYNNYGQLGLGDTANRTSPTQVGTDTDWVSVTVGRHHSLAIKADGTLWVWGYNVFGQLGQGDTVNRTSPTQVGTDTDWAQAAGNGYSSYAIKTGGALWTWGYNYYGQLGLGDTANRTSPTQVGTDTDWVTVQSGESFAMGIRSDGTLWAWGDNTAGQLGQGDTANRTSPTQVGTDTDWAGVEGGSRHVIAVRTDGALWAWGNNYAGNLGLGDLNNRLVPTQVGIGTDWAFPVAGVNDSGALKTDGSAWLWGYNLEDHLGFGADAPSRFTAPTLLAAPPVLGPIGDKSVDELSELTFTATATDADVPADTLTYSLDASAPVGAAIDSATGVFTWTPTEAQGPGSYPITVSVSDGKGGVDSEAITVTVAEVNTAPVLGAIGDKSVNESSLLTFTASATDADIPAQALTYRLAIPAPSGAAMTPDGVFTWTPSEAHGPGSYPVTVIVTDGVSSAFETITITVAEVNAAPVLGAIGDKTVDELSELTFTASSTDADLPANTLAYSLAAGAPAEASIDSTTGAFSWTPTEAQGPGSYDITVVVTDGKGGVDSETITVTVAEVNTAPVLDAIGDKSVNELSELTFTASATDADLPANTLTYTLGAGAPAGASIDSTTGVFSWTPTEAQGPGSYPVTVTVSDGKGGVDSETITVTVAEVNAAPVLDVIGDKSVDELAELTFTAAATDAEGGAIAYSLEGAPTGAVIDPVTGVFSWTPTEAQGPGTYSITVVASDGELTDSETITITVAEVNTAPVLGAIGNKSVDELDELTFIASATDADVPANTLIYSLGAGAPAGAAIDSATGVFSWTPTEAQGPGTYSITVTVSDGTASDSEAITITVAEVADEQPPTSTYSPPVTSSGGTSPDEQDSGATADEDAESDTATETDAPAEDTDDGDAEAEDADEAAAADEPEADAPADDESGFPWWILAVAGALAGVGLAGWAIRARNAGSGA
jgi:alpha-tubulin suppressor-like RCC1 family protein